MLENLIRTMPKAELHLHIEGSLEPDLMMELANKHQIALPYKNVVEIAKAYQFEDLQSFLDLYYFGASVLIDEDDFFQLMWRYLLKCREDNVVHTEVMFDPQTHTERGIAYSVFMQGFSRAIEKANQEWGQSTYLILSFLRHLSEAQALETLDQARPYLHLCTAVGLDSSEKGNPPENFSKAFDKAAEFGLKKVAHAGEEGPPEYIWNALNILGVDRIDHGVRCVEDLKLVEQLKHTQTPLTICPLSNIKLCVFENMRDHNVLKLLDAGLNVTINADDPSYFGGYLNDNYLAVHNAHSMTQHQAIKLATNSFNASFLPENVKQYWRDKLTALSTTVT